MILVFSVLNIFAKFGGGHPLLGALSTSWYINFAIVDYYYKQLLRHRDLDIKLKS